MALTCRQVALAPVFCVRSLLPAPLQLAETPGGLQETLAGRGSCQPLHCDPALTHQLTMKLRSVAAQRRRL